MTKPAQSDTSSRWAKQGFEFFLESPAFPVSSGDPIWKKPLPAGPGKMPEETCTPEDRQKITYGDLFCAVADFLSRPDTWQKANLPIPVNAIHPTRIFLAKHGAFYHPCRIETGKDTPALVVNVAVSTPGREIIETEFNNFIKLGRTKAAGFLPTVYHLGHGRCTHEINLPMFMGQWLDGYYEFHLSFIQAKLQVAAWKPEGKQVLDRMQVTALMRQAACILAACYDPISMEAVGRFHQAAGDFVVRPVRGDLLQLRLISIREYRPLTDSRNKRADLHLVLDGLLVLLLKTSLQLRLDRLDGVGRYILYPSWTLDPIWQGFVEGVAWAFKSLDLPLELTEIMTDYFRQHNMADWIDISSTWLEHYPAGSPEKHLLAAELENHLGCLKKAMAK